MTTKIGTISISALKPPSCSNWSFPPSTITQSKAAYIETTVKNNANVTADFQLRYKVKDKDGNILNEYSLGYLAIGPGKSEIRKLGFIIPDNSSNCYTSWKIYDIAIYAKYKNKTYGPYCSASERTFTLAPEYKGSLGTGHTIPSSAYLGDTINFTIKGKNTNKCFSYNLWAKIICKLSTDESKKFEGTGSKVKTNAGKTSNLPVSVQVPTNVPEGTYNIYAELHAGA